MLFRQNGFEYSIPHATGVYEGMPPTYTPTAHPFLYGVPPTAASQYASASNVSQRNPVQSNAYNDMSTSNTFYQLQDESSSEDYPSSTSESDISWTTALESVEGVDDNRLSMDLSSGTYRLVVPDSHLSITGNGLDCPIHPMVEVAPVRSPLGYSAATPVRHPNMRSSMASSPNIPCRPVHPVPEFEARTRNERPSAPTDKIQANISPYSRFMTSGGSIGGAQNNVQNSLSTRSTVEVPIRPTDQSGAPSLEEHTAIPGFISEERLFPLNLPSAKPSAIGVRLGDTRNYKPVTTPDGAQVEVPLIPSPHNLPDLLSRENPIKAAVYTQHPLPELINLSGPPQQPLRWIPRMTRSEDESDAATVSEQEGDDDEEEKEEYTPIPSPTISRLTIRRVWSGELGARSGAWGSMVPRRVESRNVMAFDQEDFLPIEGNDHAGVPPPPSPIPAPLRLADRSDIPLVGKKPPTPTPVPLNQPFNKEPTPVKRPPSPSDTTPLPQKGSLKFSGPPPKTAEDLLHALGTKPDKLSVSPSPIPNVQVHARLMERLTPSPALKSGVMDSGKIDPTTDLKSVPSKDANRVPESQGIKRELVPLPSVVLNPSTARVTSDILAKPSELTTTPDVRATRDGNRTPRTAVATAFGQNPRNALHTHASDHGVRHRPVSRLNNLTAGQSGDHNFAHHTRCPPQASPSHFQTLYYGNGVNPWEGGNSWDNSPGTGFSYGDRPSSAPAWSYWSKTASPLPIRPIPAKHYGR